MNSIDIPNSFEYALLNSHLYPENNIHRTINTYPQSLKRAQSRLCEKEYDLFEDNKNKWEIPIRDLGTDCGKDVDKYNIQNHTTLTDWLGLVTEVSCDNIKTIKATKKDPKCRFLYIYGMHSRSKLKLTKAMLTDILTYHQVMPAFLDFLYLFGQTSEPSDIQFSRFQEQVNLSNTPGSVTIPNLGRSGRQYQTCYNLKSVALANEYKGNIVLNEWSIRQAVFHHQFDVVTGNTLWIVVKGNLEIQQRFKALTGKSARPQDRSFSTPEECFRSSLSAHLMYCYWATEDWRWYIKWLETAVDQEHIMALLGPSEAGYSHKTYTPRDIQDLQIWEERARKAIIALEGNVDVMLALVSFYRRLAQHRDFPLGKACSVDISVFATELRNIITELKMQIKRAEFLVRTVSDRRQLVIQHLQSQAASRAEDLSRSMEKEQAFMLTITVVTLIFLPATFVSTFFSTDIIKYQDTDSPGGEFSATALIRWFEVTIPLTLITVVIAVVARWWAITKREGSGTGIKWYWRPWQLNKDNWSSSIGILPSHSKSQFDVKC